MLRKGVRIEDDSDEDDKPKFDPKSLDANRQRSKFEKGLDNDLFGGPMKKKQPIKKTVQKTPEVVKKTNEPKVIPEAKPKETQPKKPLIQNKQTIPKKQAFPKRQTPVPVNKQKQSPIKKQINFPSPTKPLDESKEQPKHYEPKIDPQKHIDVGEMVYNKPIYIRKLKKIAENFNFFEKNTNLHCAVDIPRPGQCIRSYMLDFNSTNYHDFEFPSNQKAFGKIKINATWKKPFEIFKNAVFGKYIDPNDFKPGKFSSQYFLSTLSCLSEMQMNIKRLIEDQQANKNDFYLIRLFVNSVWRYVAVDSYLPQQNNQILGVSSYKDSQSEFCCSLIQKAYAKIFSGYDVFSRIQPRQYYLRDLTGAPVMKYMIDNPKLGEIVKNAISAGHVVMVVPKPSISKIGINPNYSLSILGLNSNGNFMIRNSWGTTEEKTRISFSKEGVFELNSTQIKDFLSYVMIARINPQYYTSTIQSKHHFTFYSAYSFTVSQQAHGYLTISQWDRRLFPEGMDYEYSPFRMILMKKDENDQENYFNAVYSHTTRNTDMEVNLSVGNYVLYCSGFWQNKHHNFNINFYGSEKITFRRLKAQENPNMIAQGFSLLNQKEGKLTQLGFINQYLLYHQASNLILLTVVNNSDVPYDFPQDISYINFRTLEFLTVRDRKDSLVGMTGLEMKEFKNYIAQNRKWQPINLDAYQSYTWVIKCAEQYDPSNYKKWALR